MLVALNSHLNPRTLNFYSHVSHWLLIHSIGYLIFITFSRCETKAILTHMSKFSWFIPNLRDICAHTVPVYSFFFFFFQGCDPFLQLYWGISLCILYQSIQYTFSYAYLFSVHYWTLSFLRQNLYLIFVSLVLGRGEELNKYSVNSCIFDCPKSIQITVGGHPVVLKHTGNIIFP